MIIRGYYWPTIKDRWGLAKQVAHCWLLLKRLEVTHSSSADLKTKKKKQQIRLNLFFQLRLKRLNGKSFSNPQRKNYNCCWHNFLYIIFMAICWWKYPSTLPGNNRPFSIRFIGLRLDSKLLRARPWDVGLGVILELSLHNIFGIKYSDIRL